MARKSVTPDEIQGMVRVVRGQRVMLDFDLARLYGVTTSALNQAVQRNADRFPEDFAHQLTQQEFAGLMSQTVISKPGLGSGPLMSQNAISNPARGGRRKLPRAFTEHGVAMLSSVLRSPAAVRVNIEIMRTFVRLRRLMATPGELVEQLTRLAETVRLHDDQIKAIAHVLNKMMERPEEPKRRIGFHARQEKGADDV
jgi:hypothetical protein